MYPPTSSHVPDPQRPVLVGLDPLVIAGIESPRGPEEDVAQVGLTPANKHDPPHEEKLEARCDRQPAILRRCGGGSEGKAHGSHQEEWEARVLEATKHHSAHLARLRRRVASLVKGSHLMLVVRSQLIDLLPRAAAVHA
eukprot:CAMPEP_0119534922 /NCGR_PEP_ID=MMETSP1344-20130328/48065_1 /TAXON_ID=236787 /ORGANISM="Florenciella parvula, Strain CCMP2471" /LENGTH=138 /DNA_ID=CAMNT_0007576353 /DNA_START=349 /DNA_END=765 /DNA_ORIENTATION=+